MLKHEMDQIWAAAKRLVEVAQAEGAKDAVPELIKGWVASAPGAEVQSVQSMFKALQAEAEAKKREEMLREEEVGGVMLTAVTAVTARHCCHGCPDAPAMQLPSSRRNPP